MKRFTILIPRFIVRGFLRFVTNVLIFIYRFKFHKLIIRKGTSDHMVFQDIFLLGEFKLPVKIKPKLIVDVGAYTGLSSLYYSSRFPDAKIIAVEPENSNFELLKLHTSSLPQVDAVHAGVWSKNTYLKIVDKHASKWAIMLEEVTAEDQYDIKAITIGDILNRSGQERIDILKIDIEGSEVELFSSDTSQWLPKVNIIVIELHDRMVKGCTEALYGAIDKNEWREFRKGEKVILVRKNLADSQI